MTGDVLESGAAVAARRSATAGLLLVLGSALAWSTMGFFVRMVPVDVWTVIFWRSITGGLSIAALAMIEKKRFAFEWRFTVTPVGIVVIRLVASGMWSAIYSMQNTTIANVVVIYATLPFLSALLAWLWFRERPGWPTLICSLVAGAGVAVTVSGTIAIGGGNLSGDLAAVYVTLAAAVMTVITRRYRNTPMLESAALACFTQVPLAFCLSDPFAISIGDIAWLGAFGIAATGGGLGLYMMGARRLPSAQAALLSASEVPLTPLWVWIFFDEMPATETFIGGALVMAAILWNIGRQMRAAAPPEQSPI